MHEFTLGADPEFMLTFRNEYKSAIGILPPKAAPHIAGGQLFYHDNVLAEAQLRPASSREEAVENSREMLRELICLVSPCKIVLRSFQSYPEFEVSDKDARDAGCSKEKCVYRLINIDPPKEIIENTTFRTAGGHIHLGAEQGPLQHSIRSLFVVRMLDLFLAVPTIFLDPDETSQDRRRLFGQAGTYRQPEYGIEYRTLGNFWYGSPKHVELIYDISSFVLDFVENQEYEKFWSINEDLLYDDDPAPAYHCFGYDVPALRRCINFCDKDMAEKFFLFINNYLPRKILGDIESLIGVGKQDIYRTWGF